MRFELLARRPVALVRVGERRLQLIEQIIGNGIGRSMLDSDQPERRLLDDDGVPIVERGLGNEPPARIAGEIVLVGHQHAGRRVGVLKLVGELVEHVVRHHEHRLVDQAETLLFHRRDDHLQGLARPDRMIQVGVPGLHHAPDRAQLVIVEFVAQRQARQRHVRTVEAARREVVELAVVDRQQFLGARGIRPYPTGEALAHLLGEVVGRGRGIFVDVGLFVLGRAAHGNALVVQDRRQNLRHRAVGCSPFRPGLPVLAQRLAFDRPGVGTRFVADADLFAQGFGRKGGDHMRADPVGAQANDDAIRPERRRLHANQGFDVALETRVGAGRDFCLFEFLEDVARQVFVSRLPAGGRIFIDQVAQLFDRFRLGDLHQLGDARQVQRSQVVQRHREGVIDRLDFRSAPAFQHAPLEQPAIFNLVAGFAENFQPVQQSDFDVHIGTEQLVPLEALVDAGFLFAGVVDERALVARMFEDPAVFGLERGIGLFQRRQRLFPFAVVQLVIHRRLERIAQAGVVL